MDYNYNGVVAYIKASDLNGLGLNFLNEYIVGLHDHDIPVRDDEAEARRLEALEYTPLADVMSEHMGHISPDDFMLPLETLEKYARAHAEALTIKGVAMVKLYVPMCAKGEDRLDTLYKQGLLPMLHEVFGRDLQLVRLARGAEHEAFADIQARSVVVYRA